MKEYEWKDAEHNCSYFFNVQNGLIVGQIFNLAHTNIWGVRIPITPTEEMSLGQYINMDFAKKAVEHYWEVQGRTLLEN
jgi:hypothetical protein